MRVLCTLHTVQQNSPIPFLILGTLISQHSNLGISLLSLIPIDAHSLARRPFLPPFRLPWRCCALPFLTLPTLGSLLTAVVGLGPTSPSAADLGCASTSATGPCACGSGSTSPHHAGVDPTGGGLPLPSLDPDPSAAQFNPVREHGGSPPLPCSPSWPPR